MSLLKPIIAVALILGEAGSAAELCSLSVRVHSLKNGKGQVLISLFDQEKAFPSQTDLALKKDKIELQGETVATFKILGVKPGDYAISVVHDENGDGKLGTNFLGIPNEGVGSSNDAKGSFGPPKFRDARFTVPSPCRELSLEVKMAYL